MGFKLGRERGLEATSGEIKTKMRFGKQSGGEGSVPGTPVIRVPLEEGDNFEILGEANILAFNSSGKFSCLAISAFIIGDLPYILNPECFPGMLSVFIFNHIIYSFIVNFICI